MVDLGREILSHTECLGKVVVVNHRRCFYMGTDYFVLYREVVLSLDVCRVGALESVPCIEVFRVSFTFYGAKFCFQEFSKHVYTKSS